VTASSLDNSPYCSLILSARARRSRVSLSKSPRRF
jgi:hypothetical protein